MAVADWSADGVARRDLRGQADSRDTVASLVAPDVDGGEHSVHRFSSPGHRGEVLQADPRPHHSRKARDNAGHRHLWTAVRGRPLRVRRVNSPRGQRIGVRNNARVLRPPTPGRGIRILGAHDIQHARDRDKLPVVGGLMRSPISPPNDFIAKNIVKKGWYG